MRLFDSSPKDIEAAADLLRGGGLVAFPTETVYGLGARADDPAAVGRIFVAKGRPADHPLIVHLGRADELRRWARDIPPAAWALAEQFWPGPLTLILKRAAGVPDAVTGGQDTVGLRMPGHPAALALLRAAGVGIAAPSANRFGRPSPTTAAHVQSELGGTVDGIVDGGPCDVGLESTILDLSGPEPRVLRPGAVGPEPLAGVLGATPGMGGVAVPRVPGSCTSHYAPNVPLHLEEGSAIEAAARTLLEAGVSVAVLALRGPSAQLPNARWWHLPNDPERYGRLLYARVREAEESGCECILVELPPATAAWTAVHDRLARASSKPVAVHLQPPAASARLWKRKTALGRKLPIRT